MTLKQSIVALLLLALVQPAVAVEGVQEHDAILQAAEDFLRQQISERHGEEIEVSVEPLDPRLRLAACAEPLEAFLPAGGRLLGGTTVGVRCAAPSSWSLYVSARVSAFAEVLVAARNLPNKRTLSAADVTTARHDLSRLPHGYFSEPREVEAMMTRRRLTAGTVLTPGALKEAPLVRRNEKVTLIVDAGGVQIRAVGVALEEGTRGQSVKVRNQGSKRVIEGIVVGPGLVEMRP